jgi:hypothetical protein
MPWMLEYISHNSLLGFHHIHLGVAFSKESIHMHRLATVLSSFISEGKLSLISQAGDNIDFAVSVGGIEWDREVVSIFQSNLILYLVKGLADYLAVFDVDEFLILKPQYSSIQDFLRIAIQHPSKRHPYCYIRVSSKLLAHRLKDISNNDTPRWLAKLFPHGAEASGNDNLDQLAYPRAIFPTEMTYQAGINSGGGCRLPSTYIPCESQGNQTEFCYKDRFLRDPVQKSADPLIHFFDEVVENGDANIVDPLDAVLLHFLIYYDFQPSLSALSTMNDYVLRYFINVKQDLESRRLDDMKKLDLPEVFRRPQHLLPTWTPLHSNAESEYYRLHSSSEVVSTSGLSVEFNSTAAEASSDVVELPHFTYNYTDYVLGAMIERESDSYKLFVTAFFLARDMLVPKEGDSAVSVETVHPKAVNLWQNAMKNFNYSDYYDNGERLPSSTYKCMLKSTSSFSNESLNCRFVPNRVTPDSNSNRRLDILRCPMEGSKNIYYRLEEWKNKNEELLVEIYRDSRMIISFRIPWRTRMTGYMLSPPPPSPSPAMKTTSTSENLHPLISTFDPWQNVDISQPPDQWKHDRLYMCVPGLESAPDKITLPLYLEFIEHHLQLGVDKIFIVASFAWGGRHMQTYLRLLEDYIKEGRVSVQSSSYDGYDFVYSFDGLQLDRDNVKNFYVNMCTYFSKGVADYVAVWDFDEFFIPMGKHQNILDIIGVHDVSPRSPVHRDGYASPDDWKGGRGLADYDGHPLCYLILNSLTTLQEKVFTLDWDSRRSWIGQRFDHGAELTLREGKGLSFKKSIRPTRTVFQGGLHMIGACRLPAEWSGCQGFSLDNLSEEKYSACYATNGQLENVLVPQFSNYHPFDAVVFDRDARTIQTNEAFINHVQFYRFWFGATDNALRRPSEYSTRFFSKVLAALTARGFDLLGLIPLSSYPRSLHVDSLIPNLSVSAIPLVAQDQVRYSSLIALSAFLMSPHEMIVRYLSRDIFERHTSSASSNIRRINNITMTADLCRLRNQDRDISLDIHEQSNPQVKFPDESVVSTIHCISKDALDRNAINELSQTLFRSSLPVAVEVPAQSPSGILLCIPAYTMTPSQYSLGVLLEFLTYHFIAGVSHIRLYVGFTSTSPHYLQLTRILDTYIKDKRLSIESRASTNDFTFELNSLTHGQQIEGEIVRERCWSLATSRGAAYFAVWDVRDFIMSAIDPKTGIELSQGRMTLFKTPTILQLLDHAKSLELFNCSSLPCYLELSARVLSNRNENIFAVDRMWIGKRFRSPLEEESSPLNIYGRPQPRIYSSELTSMVQYQHQRAVASSPPVILVYRFVLMEDVLESFQLPNVSHPNPLDLEVDKQPSDEERQDVGNIYSNAYFPIVHERLKSLRLDFLVEIPRRSLEIAGVDRWWTKYEKIWISMFGKLPY